MGKVPSLTLDDGTILFDSPVICDYLDSLHAGAPAWLIEQCRAEALEADCVMAPSDYVRRTLVEQGVAPERIALVPFGVRVERFKPLSKEAERRINRVEGTAHRPCRAPASIAWATGSRSGSSDSR